MEKQVLDNIPFFYMWDIENHLGPEDFEKFQKWFHGQTGIIGPEGLGVYIWDYQQWERVMQGKHELFWD